MKISNDQFTKFVAWIQLEMKKDHTIVNRKIFSVVFWCLILPSVVLLTLYALRKYQWIGPMRFPDLLIFLPPFAYSLYSLWPTIRDTPKVFRKGGLNTILDESVREVEWREKTAHKMKTELGFTLKEWKLVQFHLSSELDRLKTQNRYMSILSAVVLFFMFQFLDLGAKTELMIEAGPGGLFKAIVDLFAQWSIQVFSLALFSTLFYLSGVQFQRYLNRYLRCVERISLDQE